MKTYAVGAPLGGWISDRMIITGRAKRGGVWLPEDRLRGTQLGAALLVPLSVLFSGIITTFVPGRAGLVLNLLCLFVNGLGVCVLFFSPLRRLSWALC